MNRVLTFLLFIFLVVPTWAQNFDPLEKVLNRAGSLESFLSDEQLKKDYYTAFLKFSAFTKETFPYENYLKFLSQLQIMNENMPEFGHRIWALQSNVTAEIVLPWTTDASTAVSVPKEAMVLIEKIRQATQTLSESEIRQGAEAISKDFEKLKESTSHLNGAERGQAMQSGVIKIEQDHNEYIRQLYFQRILKPALTLGDVGHHYRNLIFNVSLATFQINQFLPDLGFSPPLTLGIKNLGQEMEKHLVKPGESQNSSQFIELTRAKEVPRKFHSIFFGICTNQCMAGRPQTIEILTPASWAIPLIQGTRIFAIGDSKGQFKGAINFIPINSKIPSGKLSPLFSIDTNHPELTKYVLAPIRIAPDRTLVRTSLAEALFYELASRTPGLEGAILAIGKASDMSDNSGVLTKIRQGPGFKLGKLIKNGLDAEVGDHTFRSQVTELSIEKGFTLPYAIQTYGRLNMYLPEGDPKIEPDLVITDKTAALYVHSHHLAKQVLATLGPDKQIQFLSIILQTLENTPENYEFFRKELSSLNSRALVRLREKLRHDFVEGRLTSNGLLHRFYLKDSREILSELDKINSKLNQGRLGKVRPAYSVRSLLPHSSQINMSEQDLAEILRHLPSDRESQSGKVQLLIEGLTIFNSEEATRFLLTAPIDSPDSRFATNQRRIYKKKFGESPVPPKDLELNYDKANQSSTMANKCQALFKKGL